LDTDLLQPRLRRGVQWPVLAWFGAAVAAAFLFFALYPCLKLIQASVATREGGFTLSGYRAAIEQSYLLLEPLCNSLSTSVATALAATALGAVFAWFAMRSDLPGARWIGVFAPIPHAIPGFQLASAWVVIFTHGGLYEAFTHHDSPLPPYGGIAIWLVLTLHMYLFAFMTVCGALSAVDPSLEEAARVAGLRRARVWAKVTLPLVTPALLSGLLLAFAYSLEEFGAPNLLGSPTGFTTLTMQIYELATTPPLDFQGASVLSVLLGVFALGTMMVNLRLAARRNVVTVGGKAARRSGVSLGNWRWPLAVLVWSFLIATSLLPLGALTLVSFLDSWGNGYGPSNWTLARHLAVLNSPELRQAVLNTVCVAAAAAFVATVVGFVAAYGAVRQKRQWAAWMDRIGFITLSTPGLVIGLAMILAFGGGSVNLYGTYAILVVAYVVRFAGVTVRSITSNLAQISPELDAAGRVAGLTPWRVLWRITLPLTKHGIAVGFLLAFINSVKEISATSLLAGQGKETLAYEAYLRYLEGNYTQGSAISLWMIALALLVAFAVTRWAKVSFSEVIK
jgi:iron(III) transport system permease protein